jgi:hypothetical protein
VAPGTGVDPTNSPTGKKQELDISMGTNMDPTNLGAKPQRTVSTRIVEEKLL